MPANPEDTIVAVSTPPGRGAISIVRLSGAEAAAIALAQLDSPSQQLRPRRVKLVALQTRSGARLGGALLTYFKAPESYTGEDVIEISSHGSPAVVRQVLESCLAGGARLAEPGEFTLRAFLNGKMDLIQAEAVRDLIDSQTRQQALVATRQLEGELSRTLQPAKTGLIDVISHLETAVEFVEDAVRPAERPELLDRLSETDKMLSLMVESFDLGRLLNEGATAAIVGKPNVGKSSLFNCLLKYERAIVTEHPGTTRDILAEMLSVGGIPVRLLDTAGIRQAEHAVERLGVERSRSHAGEADILVFVLDGSLKYDGEDRAVWNLCRGKRYIAVINKQDLPSLLDLPSEVGQGALSTVRLSAHRQTGVDALHRAIEAAVVPEDWLEWETAPVTNFRQLECLKGARRRLRAARKALEEGLSEEYVLYDLKGALVELGQITGETTVEDILETIFSSFCIGK